MVLLGADAVLAWRIATRRGERPLRGVGPDCVHRLALV